MLSLYVYLNREVKVYNGQLSLLKSDNFTLTSTTRFLSTSLEDGRVFLSFSLSDSAGSVSASSPHSALFYSFSPSSLSVFAQTSLSASLSLPSLSPNLNNITVNWNEEAIVYSSDSGDFLAYLAQREERSVQFLLRTDEAWALSVDSYRDLLLQNATYYYRENAMRQLPPSDGSTDYYRNYFEDITVVVRGVRHFTSPTLW